MYASLVGGLQSFFFFMGKCLELRLHQILFQRYASCCLGRAAGAERRPVTQKKGMEAIMEQCAKEEDPQQEMLAQMLTQMSSLMEEARQQRARDRAQLDEMTAHISDKRALHEQLVEIQARLSNTTCSIEEREARQAEESEGAESALVKPEKTKRKKNRPPAEPARVRPVRTSSHWQVRDPVYLPSADL